MALPTWYDTGTVSVANGSASVTGTGTLWGDDAIMAGDLFCDLAQPLVPPQRIASVEGNGALTLAAPWPGTALTDDAYEIRYVGIIERSTAQTRRVLEGLGAIEANGRGLFYRFSTATTDADPGDGYLRLNHATPASATVLYIDGEDANASDLLALIDTWDDGSSTIKGQIALRSIDTPSKVLAFDVGIVTTATGYRKVAIAFVDGDAAFVADEGIMVDFSRTGDAGADGIFAAIASEAESRAGTNNTKGMTPLASAQAIGERTHPIACGRLTLESMVPYSQTDQLAKTSVLWTPFQGAVMGLYGAVGWEMRDFAETSLSLAGFTASKPYDIFAYDNAGTMALEALVWTNDTTRATALALQDGVEIKSGDPTRRYLATIYTSATGQTQIKFGSAASGGGPAYLGIWNRYNRVQRAVNVVDSDASHSYMSATIRPWAGGGSCKVSMIRGLDIDAVAAEMVALFTTAVDGYANIGLGLDGATFAGPRLQNYVVSGRIASSGTAIYKGMPGLGFHYLQGLEQGDGITTTAFQGSTDYHRLSANLLY